MATSKAGDSSADKVKTLQAQLGFPNSTAETLEARLRQLRRQVASMRSSGLPTSAILHPFYQSASDDGPGLRQAVGATIHMAQDSVQAFLQEVSEENGQQSASIPSLSGASALADPAAAAAATHASKAEQAGRGGSQSSQQNSMSHLVSLLREQSAHTHLVCQLLDTLAAPSSEERGARTMAKSTVPAVLAICALAPQQSKGASLDAWPTSSGAVAADGLKKLVDAFAAVASSEMQLESFAEERTPANAADGTEQPSSYTLTLAAHILVIDADFSIEQRAQTSGHNATWAPVVRVRISYATDTSTIAAGGSSQVLRNSQLAQLLQTDMDAIAHTVFQTSPAATIGEIPDLESTTQHLRRLEANVQALRRLDKLSSTLSSLGKPDLFALMDDVTSKIERSLISWRDCRLLHYCGRPYGTIVYHGVPTKVTEEQLALRFSRQTLGEKADEVTPLHIVHVDVARLDGPGVMVVESDLPAITSTNGEVTNARMIARLDPPLPMQKWLVRELARAAGVEDHKEPARQPIDQESSLHGVPTWLEDLATTGQAGSTSVVPMRFVAHTDDEPSETHALLVRHFPFASTGHLGTAIAILQQQARLNDVLSPVATSSQVANASTLEDRRVSVSVCRSEDDRRTACIVLSVPLNDDPSGQDTSQEIRARVMLLRNKDNGSAKWSLKARISEAELDLVDGETIVSTVLNAQGEDGLLAGVVEGLLRWGRSKKTGAPKGLHVNKRTRESEESEALDIEKGGTDRRPTNRPRT